MRPKCKDSTSDLVLLYVQVLWFRVGAETYTEKGKWKTASLRPSLKRTVFLKMENM